MHRIVPHPWIGPLVFLLLVLTAPATAHAQIGGLRDAARQIGERLPDPSSLYDKPPITTSLTDAVWGADEFDGRIPETDLVLRDDAEIDILDGYEALVRTEGGGFVLAPGFYEFHHQSYCLKAGTHGPGGGDGYLYAPPAGPAEAAVMAILRGSVDQPEITQHDIQLLLWAIIARTKFEDLDPRLKAVAARFLDPQMLLALNRSALDILPDAVMQQLLAKMPNELRTIVEAEARLRRMLTQPGGSFADIERIAVLTGAAPLGPGSREVPSGRWSLHPDGYYVRYLPQGYSYTVVQIWVPEGSPAVGQEYDPAAHIAVPGNTARQRLIQSGRAQQS